MPWMMDIPDPCFGGFYFIGSYVLIIFVDSSCISVEILESLI